MADRHSAQQSALQFAHFGHVVDITEENHSARTDRTVQCTRTGFSQRYQMDKGRAYARTHFLRKCAGRRALALRPRILQAENTHAIR